MNWKVVACAFGLLIGSAIVGLVGVVWAQGTAQATTDARVESLEQRIEQLRVENREDHRQIMDLLKSK